MFKQSSKFIAGLALGAGLLHGASAASVLFVGSGTWDSDAAFSSFSKPGSAWSISFQLPDVIAQNPSTGLSAFSYRLDGSAVAATPASIQFYAAADSGMFDIRFQDAQVLSFYGSAVLAGQSLTLGTYDVFNGLAGGVPVGSGSLTLQAVPEPANALLFALGLAALGWRGLRRAAAVRAA